MRRLLLSLLLSLLPAHAADLPRVHTHGFSSDGRHHLLVTSHRQDGSGFGTARLEIRALGGELLHEDELTDRSGAAMPEMLAGMLLNRSGAALARHRLERPVPGEPLWVRPVPLPSLEGWPELRRGTVELPRGRGPAVAWRSETASSDCEWTDMLPGPVQRLSVTVSGRSFATLVPEGRLNCAGAHAVEGVWAYGPYLAVLVRVYVPGFEGPNAVPLFLTGRR